MTDECRKDKVESWRRVALVSWALVGVLLLFSFGLWLLSRVAPAMTPLLLALIVVFLLRRPVVALQKRGMSRSVGVLVCYITSFIVLTILGLFIIPPLVSEVRSFTEAFPGYYDSAYNLWLQLEGEYALLEVPEWIKSAAEGSREGVLAWMTEFSGNFALSVFSIGGQIVGFFVNAFLALALAFFVLRDLPTLKAEVLSLPGPARQQETLKLAGDVTVVLEGFIRGQLMIAAIVGVATAVGLAVIGVPYALVIGLIAGVTNLIPYLGPLVGGAIAAISASFLGLDIVIYTLIWIVVLQQAESLLLQPKIMSDQVHLHPVLVILSLLVGATLFGLLGMLVAVPTAAVVKVMFIHYYEKWTESSISGEDGALFRSPSPKEGRSDRRRGAKAAASAECREGVEDDVGEGDPGEGR